MVFCLTNQNSHPHNPASYDYLNQQRILPQYIIKAIGEPSKLESTLLGNGGYVDTLRKYGFDITIERENRINIPKYSKDISYKYIQ